MRKYNQNLENNVIKPKINLYTKSKILKNGGKHFKTWKVAQCDGNFMGSEIGTLVLKLNI